MLENDKKPFSVFRQIKKSFVLIANKSITFLLKFKTPHQYRAFSLLQPSEMASVSNFGWQNRKERPNRFTNNGDRVEKAIRSVKSEYVGYTLVRVLEIS